MHRRQHQRISDAEHPLALIDDLRRLTLDAMDPVFAAQNRLREGQPNEALIALNQSSGPAADLTRARALMLLGRTAEAWALYETYESTPFQGLARIALANIAAADGNSDHALTMLANAGSSPASLRVDTAIALGQLDWAEQWLDEVTGQLA